jgi:hypothetical protein
MKHPGHTYGGFVPAFSERGMTEREREKLFRRKKVMGSFIDRSYRFDRYKKLV